jgi:hypothetical protein
VARSNHLILRRHPLQTLDPPVGFAVVAIAVPMVFVWLFVKALVCVTPQNASVLVSGLVFPGAALW